MLLRVEELIQKDVQLLVDAGYFCLKQAYILLQQQLPLLDLLQLKRMLEQNVVGLHILLPLLLNCFKLICLLLSGSFFSKHLLVAGPSLRKVIAVAFF